MEAVVFTRIAMAGWLFGGTVLLFLARHGESNILWRTANNGLLGREFAGLAAAGAVILAVLPVIGYLISAGVDLVRNVWPRGSWWFPRNPWRMKEVGDEFRDVFEEEMRGVGSERTPRRLKGTSNPALFHSFFYSQAGDEVIEWRRRRLTMFHLAANNVAGVVVGCVVGHILSHHDSWHAVWWVLSVGGLLGMFCSACNAYLEYTRFRAGTLSWVEVLGPVAVQHWLKTSGVDGNLAADAKRRTRDG